MDGLVGKLTGLRTRFFVKHLGFLIMIRSVVQERDSTQRTEAYE